jgi:hypothetical protein
MRSFAEFPDGAGGVIVVEVDGPAGWSDDDRPVTRGLGGGAGEVVEKAGTTFGQAISRIQPAATGLIASLRASVDPPDEVDIEFGVQMSADFGAVIAKASAEANFKVALHWKAKPSKG